MLLDMNRDAELALIGSPALLIGCTHDAMRTPVMVKELATRIPGAHLVEADSGHLMHFLRTSQCAFFAGRDR